MCTWCLKARVAKRWCLEQLNTFSVCGRRCPRRNQVDGRVGRLFHRNGPAAANAQSSRRELVPVTVHLKLSDIKADVTQWRQLAGSHLSDTVVPLLITEKLAVAPHFVVWRRGLSFNNVSEPIQYPRNTNVANNDWILTVSEQCVFTVLQWMAWLVSLFVFLITEKLSDWNWRFCRRICQSVVLIRYDPPLHAKLYKKNPVMHFWFDVTTVTAVINFCCFGFLMWFVQSFVRFTENAKAD